MTRWEVLEEFLFTNDYSNGATFTVYELADSFGCTPQEASALIQGHLQHQRGPKPSSLYVITRQAGRTKSAVWTVGHRSIDAQSVGRQFADDLARRYLIAVRPDLMRIGSRNPRARARVEKIVTFLGQGVELMAGALDE